ncbi:UDP-N-acetylmuramoyl-L-alanine--D-glutamate ligase [Sinanaerobacter sp. ZZT-01]|uniref:UDP-N-acetylmuramoyl-L-alanine--D-glutamate ligase n=1 Tax=Sinanaerobacter sp. ZZT-01 TaxID=3111540 RepID=UPI002D782B6C|nr:UDP-N-acetylmuramoyl-L-alanine--D-glutamate ligase [Sinanaerobacter sp. ZZT-01]WRR93708.1 UDP-N-acetylmuramoyl-L-alanine--D-glutamate ligase [Sinanaerobacter sp. ZZT-01]
MNQTKKYLVVGLGRSGVSAAEALLRYGAEVSVYDKKTQDEIEAPLVNYLKTQQVTCYLGTDPSDLGRYDAIVVSPGVPLDLPFLQKAKTLDVEIIGELELAYRLGKGNYIAITGTNGKTTTTTLVGEIFKNAKRKTAVVGNIGIAVTSTALVAQDDSWLVTECSSFQLETTEKFHPVVCALLNITPDHLDRHKTLENYAKAKAKVFKNQTEKDFFVVNYDDPVAYHLIQECRSTIIPFSRKSILEKGVFVKDNRIIVKDQSQNEIDICGVDELVIPGQHNLENALAACGIAYFCGISAEMISKTLREFQGVEHRLEFCAEVGGVRFVNDSKGTNPDASIKAIEAMKGNIVLIAGGYDKNSKFDEFIQAFDGKVKALVLLGATAPKIRETAERFGYQTIFDEKDMGECVKRSFSLAEPGDTVLLSPACASWDMYSSYEQRGKHFKSCVQELER